MTDKAISPLRRRMIEDMTVRNFAAKTSTRLCAADRRTPCATASPPICWSRTSTSA